MRQSLARFVASAPKAGLDGFRSQGCPSGDGFALVSFDQLPIRSSDEAVSVHVVAEVRCGHGLTAGRLDQIEIRLIDQAVGIYIGNQEAEGDVIRSAASVDVPDPDGHDLFVRDTSKRHSHFVAVEGRRSRRRGPAKDDRRPGGNSRVISEDGGVVAAGGAVFYPDVPLIGIGTSKVPALPWVTLDAALTRVAPPPPPHWVNLKFPMRVRQLKLLVVP